MQYSIYECPARESNRLPIEYMVAVMNAAKEGKPVQYRSFSVWANQSFDTWTTINESAWNWSLTDYRIDPSSAPKPAPKFKAGDYVVCIDDDRSKGIKAGNVYQISRIHDDGECYDLAQIVGYSLGWYKYRFRLANESEIKTHLLSEAAKRGIIPGNHFVSPNGPIIASTCVEYTIGQYHEFVECEDGKTYCSNGAIGIKPAPKTKTKQVPMTQSDYPATVWLRFKETPECPYLVLGFMNDHPWIMQGAGRQRLHPVETMTKMEWSADRKTWNPCYKLAEDKS